MSDKHDAVSRLYHVLHEAATALVHDDAEAKRWALVKLQGLLDLEIRDAKNVKLAHAMMAKLHDPKQRASKQRK